MIRLKLATEPLMRPTRQLGAPLEGVVRPPRALLAPTQCAKKLPCPFVRHRAPVWAPTSNVPRALHDVTRHLRACWRSSRVVSCHLAGLCGAADCRTRDFAP
jgi:hypothetical protein